MKKVITMICILFLCGCSSTPENVPSLKEIVENTENPYLRSKGEVKEVLTEYFEYTANYLGYDISDLKLPKIVEFDYDYFKYYYPDAHFTTFMYNFNYQAIFVPTKITVRKLRNDFASGLLVHEFAHYIQHQKLDISKLPCLDVLEEDAYKVQFNFLKKRNKLNNFPKNKYIEEIIKCTAENPFKEV